MYRAVTMKVLTAGVEGSRGQGVEWTEADGRRIGKPDAQSQKPEAKAAGAGAADLRALAELLRHTSVSVRWDRRGMRTFLDGKDVSKEIRSPEVSGFVSEVSAIPAVRRKMVAEQRRVAAGQSVVCEGRDIGSVVFPDADLKVFLGCDTEERARRRQLELGEQGVRATHRAVRANLVKRDRIDSGRATSPLRRMPDAVLVDTSYLTIEEQVEVVCDLARRKTGLLKSEARSQEPKAKAMRLGTRTAEHGRC